MVKCTKEVMQLASEIKGLILDKNDLSDGEVLDSIYDIVKKYDIHEQEVEEYARKCDATGEGMNDGFVVNDGDLYFAYEKDLVEYLRSLDVEEFKGLSDKLLIEKSYELEYHYWTEWEDEDEYQYEMINGVLYEKD